VPVTDRYAAFVSHWWDRLEELTGHTPFYVDRQTIATYCPRCRTGTVVFRFVEHPKPTAFPSSDGGGQGCCSGGCTAVEIAQAVAR
jgi:hypothetical protein